MTHFTHEQAKVIRNMIRSELVELLSEMHQVAEYKKVDIYDKRGFEDDCRNIACEVIDEIVTWVADEIG